MTTSARVVVLVLVALIVVLAGCARAASGTAVELGSDATDPDIGPPATILPVERCGDFFLVMAALNGRGPFRLKLDTGYPRTQLSPAAAASLGARRSIRSIEAGDFRARGRIPIGVTDLDALGLALGRDYDGIIGYTVFRDLLITYDFPAGAVRLRRGSLPGDDPGVVPMSRGDRPFIRARIGGRTVDLVLDTGSDGGVSLLDFEEFALQEEPRTVGAFVRTDGVFRRRGGRLAEDMEFGAFTLSAPVVVNAARRNLLGQDVLRHFVVTLDRANGRARFRLPEPRDGAAPPVLALPPIRGSGLVMAPDGDRFRVVDVLVDSPAEAAGIRAGDHVVAIDGRGLRERGCPARGPEAEQAPRTLTLERDEARRDVVLEHRVLVP